MLTPSNVFAASSERSAGSLDKGKPRTLPPSSLSPASECVKWWRDHQQTRAEEKIGTSFFIISFRFFDFPFISEFHIFGQNLPLPKLWRDRNHFTFLFYFLCCFLKGSCLKNTACSLTMNGKIRSKFFVQASESRSRISPIRNEIKTTV